MDGYNGGPRGAEGSLCKGSFCERDGLDSGDVDLDFSSPACAKILIQGKVVWSKEITTSEEGGAVRREALDEHARLITAYPNIPSGTRLERGCHHAEMNVVCNAAANGVKTEGAWLIVTGEPCLMCAKILHHAGVEKVLCVKGGYKGGDDGPSYLRENGVLVEYVEGPQDPR